MEEPSNQTQKELGRKYRDNLGYFRKAAFIARQKFFLCALAVLVGAYLIVQLEITRADKIYNPAPLSIQHAHLEGNCAACHNPASRNILGILQSGIAPQQAPEGGEDSPAIHVWSAFQKASFSSSVSINHACESCHADMDLHQPTMQTLALKQFHSELHVVAANGCFSCHQEHLGRIDLKLPGDSACAACHNDAGQMASGIMRVALTGTAAPRQGMDGITSDGVIHFIPPERKEPLPLFASFERGHPPFEYEQPGLKDPDVLSFDHHLHLRKDMKLGCADCHQPAADGMYYQKVTYEAACERCHSLQFDPNNPELLIPHGDVSRLRSYLHSLVFQYSELDKRRLAEQGKAATPDEQKAFAVQQIFALLQRAHVQTPGDLDTEILFTANPYKDRPPTAERPFFSGCAYCHQVNQAQGGGDPVITPPLMPERWLAHGPFTHAKHTFMSCEACHDAQNSREATDIIMPAKASCTACHRAEGSAPTNCLACHGFHSPQSVVKMIKGEWHLPPPPMAGCPATGKPAAANILSTFLISEQHPIQ